MTHGHAQEPRLIMFELKVLICKRFGAIDVCRSSPVAIKKIASLNHKFLDLSNVLSHAFSGRGYSVQSLTTR